ncbi:MAG: TRAP transporter small permease [Aminipila sp.]
MKKEKGDFFAIINKAEDICLVFMFFTMVAVIFLQIIMRYVFNDSLTWSEELGKFIFVWISWLGISIGQRRNEHIKITMLTDKLPIKAQTVVNIIANVILIAILLVTVYYAFLLVQSQQRVPYAGIKISTSWGYLSLVLGCSFMTLRLIGEIITNIKSLIHGIPENLAEGGVN